MIKEVYSIAKEQETFEDWINDYFEGSLWFEITEAKVIKDNDDTFCHFKLSILDDNKKEVTYLYFRKRKSNYFIFENDRYFWIVTREIIYINIIRNLIEKLTEEKYDGGKES